MADAMFLHIRSPDPGQPPRVLSLDRLTLRIGHGPRCDLALADPALAEVHCILRRRGEDWTIQPIGPVGLLLTLDGRPVDTTLRVPVGATLRIGRYTLRLLDPRPAGRFGAYPPPPAIAPDPDHLAEATPIDPSPLDQPIHRPVGVPAPHVPPVASERERLARWQTRQPLRSDLSRREERLREWTARWDAVGRDIRARSAAPRPAAPTLKTPPPHKTPPPETRIPPVPSHAPTPPAAAPPATCEFLALPAPTPALAPTPIGEPEPIATESPNAAIPDRDPVTAQPADLETDAPIDVAEEAPAIEPEPAPEPAPESPPTLPAERHFPSVWISEPDPAPEPFHDEVPAPAEAGSFADIDEGPVESLAPPEPLVDDSDSGEAEPSRGTSDIPDLAREAPESTPQTTIPNYLVASDFELGSATWRELASHFEPADEIAADTVPPPVPPATAVVEVIPDREPEPTSEPTANLTTPEPDATVAPEPTSDPATPPEAAVVQAKVLPAPADPVIVSPATGVREALAGVSEWPSAKVILEQYRRDRAATPSAPHTPPRRPTSPLPQPTIEYVPRAVTLPGRVSVSLAATLVLLVGTGMLALSWSWAQDDRLAGILANQLVRPGHTPRQIAVPESSPALSWWRSTADHLYLRALARALGHGNDTGSAEEIHTLLDAARAVAPLHRQVRLARIDTGDPGVGLSRDVLALRQTGKRLLQAGKTEAALRVYQDALRGLDQVDLAAAPVPAFVEETDVRRFQLPGESLVAPILNDLAAAQVPTEVLARWYDALPRRAILGLALFRFHHARGESEAAAQAARIALEADPPARPAARALHLASQAEVLALSGSVQEAVDRYNAAIVALPEGLVRRTWAMNLGELESRLGHDAQAREAWSIARGDDPDDAINLRLVEARRRRGHLAPPDLLVTPASRPVPPDREVQRAGFESRPDEQP